MQNRELLLIDSTIANGRIYFPITDAIFFPADSLSDRKGDGHKGVPVVFQAGTYRLEGPIRVSSGQRLSPTRSFSPFLKAIGAASGDRLRVERASEREYVVHFIRSVRDA